MVLSELMQWTFIIMVSSVAHFPGTDFSRDWLYTSGPYQTEEECKAKRLEEKSETKVSQCMSLLHARAITQPFNQGAFVLIHEKESTNYSFTKR